MTLSKKYFWDVDPSTIDLQKHKRFVIERLLEYGDVDELAWLQSNYPKSDLIETLKVSRQLSPKTANFYGLLFKVPQEEILCMRTLSTKKPRWF